MKYLKYILIIFILILTPNVFAADVNINSLVSATAGGSTGKYKGTEYYNTGTQNTYNIGTRYNGRLSYIEFFVDYSNQISPNTTYTFTLNMETDDWRNNFMYPKVIGCQSNGTESTGNLATSSVSFISMKKIKFTFKTQGTLYPLLKVIIYSGDLSNTGITGVNNWKLTSILLNDPYISSGGSGGSGGSSPTPTPQPSNQDIINNANENAQEIIDNNNQNTQDIIENNNQNTQNLIDNNNQNTLDEINQQRLQNTNNCDNVLSFNLGKGYSISNSGNLVENEDSYYSLDYVPIPNLITQLTITNSTKNNVSGNYIIVYDSNYNVLDYWYSNNRVVSLPVAAAYFKVSSTQHTIQVFAGNKGCLNNVDSFLTDDSNPNIQDNDFLNMFNSVGVSDPLNYLLTLPTQLINKLVSLSDTCSPIELGSLYGTMLTLPCINLENILGSSIWHIIDVIFSVSLLVVILKNLYDTFSNLLTMGAEKEAKEKFSMPTPMDFLSMILGGDR